MWARLAALIALAIVTAGCTIPGGPQPAAITYPSEVLGGAPWTTLVVEIDHARGYKPSDAAVAHLISTLKNITSKTEVRVSIEETLPSAAKKWNATELLALEKETRSTQHAAPTALLHILYPAGEYETAGVAGVTIAGVSLGPAVVFLDTLRKVETDIGPLPLPGPGVDVIERATLLHEVGHAFGLVNNGIDMVRDHEDSTNERHSMNEQSVMYWKVESLNGLRELLLKDGSVPSTFDADDRADIRRVGGR